MSSLKITGLQYDIVWKDKKQNFVHIEKMLASEVADLFLLPEMFPTGFCMDVEEIADAEGEVLEWMKSFAATKSSAVAGSVSVMEEGNFYNRFYFVKPSGAVHFYDKRHLFSYSGEDKVYTPGSERVIVEYKEVRILLQVCYDLRFPVFSRNIGDYDLVLYVANWPVQRIEAWNALLKARAIENQAYVFGLNRTGKDGNGLVYDESSECYFPDGSRVSISAEHLVKADVSMESLMEFRRRFRFLDDADDFRLMV